MFSFATDVRYSSNLENKPLRSLQLIVLFPISLCTLKACTEWGGRSNRVWELQRLPTFIDKNTYGSASYPGAPSPISPHYNISCKLVICASLFFAKRRLGTRQRMGYHKKPVLNCPSPPPPSPHIPLLPPRPHVPLLQSTLKSLLLHCHA